MVEQLAAAVIVLLAFLLRQALGKFADAQLLLASQPVFESFLQLDGAGEFC